MWFSNKNNQQEFGRITYDFYQLYYIFNCEIKGETDKIVYLIASFMAIYKVNKELNGDTADIMGQYLINSMHKTYTDPGKFVLGLYNSIDADLTTKQLQEINSLGSSQTGIEVPTVEVREKPNEPFITRCEIKIYKKNGDVEIKYNNSKRKLDFILLPIVTARLFLYICNIIPEDEKKRFYNMVIEWINKQ